MDFYASLTINRCHLERLCEIWSRHQPGDNFPFHRVIVSPLVVRNGILQRLYEHRRHCKVIFDSGGFHIQQGRLDLGSACKTLERLYREHSWVDRFALPDAPITSLDSRREIRTKLRSTRRLYQAFPARLPSSLRPKLLPVVHGTTFEEVRRSAQAACGVGSRTLGFGAFSTSGPNFGVNSFSTSSVRLLVRFTKLCAEWGREVHAFGIGGPAAIVVLRYVPVASFDSAGWIRTAAYGNAYLPYLGALNVTGNAASRRYVTRREFRRLRRATGHVCSFCEDEGLLVRSWLHRALHNYCTVGQLVQTLRKTPIAEALEKLVRFNPRFAKYLHEVCEEHALSRKRTSRGG